MVERLNAQRISVKKKLMAAIAMLLIASIMLAVASYAWYTISNAPELASAGTTVTSNGNLAIALLTGDSPDDIELIESPAGSSATVTDLATANSTWGNIVDLATDAYGSGYSRIMPTRLLVTSEEDGCYVDVERILASPEFGNDGRIAYLSSDLVNGVYDSEESAFLSGGYGVRAIGNYGSHTLCEEKILAIRDEYEVASDNLDDMMHEFYQQYADDVWTMVLDHVFLESGGRYDNDDIEVLKALANDCSTVLQAIADVERYVVAAYWYTVNSEEDLTIDEVEFSEDALYVKGEAFSISEDANEYVYNVVSNLYTAFQHLSIVQSGLDALEEKSEYEWSDISSIVESILDPSEIYFQGYVSGTYLACTIEKFKAEIDDGSVDPSVLTSIQMNAGNDSGLFVDIEGFYGNTFSTGTTKYEELTLGDYTFYNVSFRMQTTMGNRLGATITFRELVSQMEYFVGADRSEDGEILHGVIVESYGYVIDLGFLTNADGDLLLQTDAVQRVYDESDNPDTQGGGSFLKAENPDMDSQKLNELVSCVRVVFMDPSSGYIYGLATVGQLDAENKGALTMTNFSVNEDGTLAAAEDDDAEEATNVLLQMKANTRCPVSVLVYLDGDALDNSMLASYDLSFDGTLNLQFSSTATLVPANNDALLNDYELSD